jgi:MFS family permease
MDQTISSAQKTLGTRIRFTTFIIVVFGVTVIVYMLVGRMVALMAERDRSDERYRNFYYAAIAIGMGVVMLRRVLLSNVQMEVVARRGVNAVLGRMSTVSMIGAALGEAVGILGMVVSILTGDSNFSWRLGMVGIMLIVYSYPRRWEWEKQVAAAEKFSARQPAPAQRLFT